jgi:hypothetical protein
MSFRHIGEAKPQAIRSDVVEILIFNPILAAAGYSLIYLLLGGGLGGAFLIFVVLKMLGK